MTTYPSANIYSVLPMFQALFVPLYSFTQSLQQPCEVRTIYHHLHFTGGKTEVQARLSAKKGKPRHSMTALSTLASWKTPEAKS